jgi:hypothetical protein
VAKTEAFRAVWHVVVSPESLFYKRFQQSQESWLRINAFLWQKRIVFTKFAVGSEETQIRYNSLIY